MSTKTYTVNRDLVLQVGAQILAGQLALRRDPLATDVDHLDKLADLSVRAAIAFDQAIPRAEERMAVEAQAAEEAEAVRLAAEKEMQEKVAAEEKAAEVAAEEATATREAAEAALKKETAAQNKSSSAKPHARS